MKKHVSLLMIAVFLLLPTILTGCIPGIGGSTKNKVEVPDNMFQTALPPIPAKPKVDIYWDTSYSMGGYTTIAAGNTFRELPDEVMDIGSTVGEAKFFRFGEKIHEMKGNEYHRLINADAYTELENSMKTVVDVAEPDHLTVVVTDLFETDAAWSAVTNKLQEKYFHKLYAVGLVGLRSPFSGTVYDVGLDHAKFDYDSGNDPKQYRPVYMILMGPDELVSSFLKRCDKKQLGGGDIKLMMFTNQLMEKPANAKNMPEVEIKNLIEQEKLELPEDSNAVEYKLHSWDKQVKMVRTFHFVPNPYVCRLDIKQLKPMLEVRYFDAESGEWATNKLRDNSFECTVLPSEDNPDNYDITLSFIPQNVLKKDTVNAMLLSIIPKDDGLILPEWTRQWNMSGAAASDPAQFDGSKTINLRRTVSSLSDSVLRVRPPSLVNLEMYIDVR